MTRNIGWSDDYWLLLMQIYLRKPIGVKPVYSKPVVELSLELHIAPPILFAKMCSIANIETPRIERIWERYGENPHRLSHEVKLLRNMNGFNNADEFYKGVDINETFEKDFKPVQENNIFTPLMLIVILDLYFHLTPITMVPETPEIIEMAKMMKIKPADIANVMDLYQHCDPYLNRSDVVFNPLMLPCQLIWQRYGNSNLEKLSSFANQLKEYFK